jgi:uncharacterized protein
MPQTLQQLSPFTLALIYMATFIIGLNKSGLRGIDMLNVTLMAIVFGSKQSTGLVLPLLCLGDILASFYYKKHVNWPLFWKLTLWMALGILVAVFWGQYWPEALFRKVFAGIIIISIGLLVWQEAGGLKHLPNHPLFSPLMGLVTGFATMMGNLAGAFATVYFSAQRVSKNEFVGTVSVVFLVINLFKLPFQILYWKNIDTQSLSANLWLLPAVFLGFFVGKYFVNKISDTAYRKVVFALTLLGSLSLLFS